MYREQGPGPPGHLMITSSKVLINVLNGCSFDTEAPVPYTTLAAELKIKAKWGAQEPRNSPALPAVIILGEGGGGSTVQLGDIWPKTDALNALAKNALTRLRFPNGFQKRVSSKAY